MHEIARTLLLAPSKRKWQDYENNFAGFFEGLDASFDGLMMVIRSFYRDHGAVPSDQIVLSILLSSNDRGGVDYAQRILQDQNLPVAQTDDAFAARLDLLKRVVLIGQVNELSGSFQAELKADGALYPDKILSSMDKMLGGLHQAKSRFVRADTTVQLRLHGDQAQDRMRERYRRNKEKRQKDETIYFPMPWAHFSGVKIGAGDFIGIPGYTSQCKSAVARELSYYMQIKHGLNVGLFTFEMPADDVESVFCVRHANNKTLPGIILPGDRPGDKLHSVKGTPKVPFDAWREGTLTDEQEDWLDKATYDFFHNRDYGSLYVEQPGDRLFNLGDLESRIADVEQTFIPLHVLTVDYLTQMNPHPKGARGWGGDEKASKNAMIAEFRQLLLTHRDVHGNPAPLIGISPFQISRGKYNEALKNDKMYDSDAPSDYNEIERSCVIMLSVLMDREMRAEGRLRLQCLKNRMGVVPTDAYEVHAALAYGMGLAEYAEPDPAQIEDQLAELDNLSFDVAA